MLIHQGWFTALSTQHLLDSQSLEFEICIFPREAIPSHYFPLREDSPRVLAWGLHGEGNPGLAVVIIPPLPPNVTNGRAKPQQAPRWKSMLIHQGWFTALSTQLLLDSQSLEFEIRIFPREAIPSQMVKLNVSFRFCILSRNDSSRSGDVPDLASQMPPKILPPN